VIQVSIEINAGSDETNNHITVNQVHVQTWNSHLERIEENAFVA
jgi:hypothetical protein